MFKILVAFFLTLSGSNILQADPAPTVDVILTEEEAFDKALSELDWKYSGSHKFPSSNSSLSVPEDFALIMGDDAKKLRVLCDMDDDEVIEAILLDTYFNEWIYFSNIKEGYVSLDEWEDIDSKNLLETISDNTEKANIERRKKGKSELHVVGWLQEPYLDRDSSTVFWILEAKRQEGDVEELIINSVALKLCRNGYERIVWASDKESFISYGGVLDKVLKGYSFDPGYCYQDYTPGDKVAEYGIAALVAATVGGNILKSSGLLLILKKWAAIILAGSAALFYKLKKIIRRNNNE